MSSYGIIGNFSDREIQDATTWMIRKIRINGQEDTPMVNTSCWFACRKLIQENKIQLDETGKKYIFTQEYKMADSINKPEEIDT